MLEQQPLLWLHVMSWFPLVKAGVCAKNILIGTFEGNWHRPEVGRKMGCLKPNFVFHFRDIGVLVTGLHFHFEES